MLTDEGKRPLESYSSFPPNNPLRRDVFVFVVMKSNTNRSNSLGNLGMSGSCSRNRYPCSNGDLLYEHCEIDVARIDAGSTVLNQR